MKKFTSALAAALLAFNILGTNPADAAEPNTISVNGMAEQEVVPDMAYVDVGITVKADEAEAARAEEARIAEEIRKSLLGLAITGDNLQSTGYNLYQEYKTAKNGGRVPDKFVISSNLKITVNDINKVSKVIDAAVKSGATDINNVKFALSSKNNVQRQLLAAAVENARSKAEIVASAGNRALGSMLSANINSFDGGTVVEAGAKLRSSVMAADNSAATQLDPGKIKLNALVQVVFSLN